MRYVFFSILLTNAITCVALSQQPARQPVVMGEVPRLYIGQPLADAKEALIAGRVGFGEGGFAISKPDPDIENLIVRIDKNHTYACVFYSKSRLQIIGLSMVIQPSPNSPRATQSWLRATELRLHPDRSYSVTFAPPLTNDELRKLEQSQPQAEFPVPHGKTKVVPSQIMPSQSKAAIEKAFRNFAEANAKQDWVQKWHCYTEEVQNNLCLEMFYSAQMKQNNPAIVAVVKSHDLADERINAIFMKKYEEKYGAYDPSKSQPPGSMQLLHQVVVECIKDKPGFYNDLMRADTNIWNVPPRHEGIRDISIEGNKAVGSSMATLTFLTIHNGQKKTSTRRVPYQVEFVFKGDKWLIERMFATEDYSIPPSIVND